MRIQDKTKEELAEEIVYLRRRLSELEHVNEALQNSESRFQALFENMGNAVAVYRAEQDGEDFVFIDFNKAAEKIEQVPRSEVLGKSVLKVFPGVKEFGLFDVFQRVWRTGCAEYYPVSEYKDNRIQGWRDNFVYRLPSGELVAVYSDETERKKAEEELAKAEELQRTILSTSPVGIGLSVGRNMVWVNDAWQEMFELGPNDADPLTINARALYPTQEEFERVGKVLYEGLEAGQANETDATMIRKDGTIFDVHIAMKAVDPSDPSRGTIAAITDISDRKRAEQALRESEARYKAIFVGATEGILVADTLTTEIKYANPAVCDMLGYTEDELMGLNISAIHPKDKLDHLLAAFQAITRGEKSKTEDVPCLRKDGTIFYATIGGASITIDGLPYNVGFFSDITDRKKAEEALRVSEQKYRVLSENIPCVAYSTLPDEHSTNLFVSGRIEELTGYSVQEFLEDPALYPRIVHPDDKAHVWEKIEEHRRQKTVLDVEYRIITRRGAVKRIRDRANPALDENGEIASISGFMEDITEWRRAEQELVKERNFSTFILDSLPGTFYLFDDQGRIMRWNNFLERASGYSSDEIASMSVLDFFPEDEKAKLQEAVHEVFTRGETYVEADWLTRGGETIPYYFSARRVYVEDQPCLIGVGIDITDRKRIERALEESEAKYRNIFDNAVEGIFQTSLEGRFITVNPALAGMFGYGSPEEMLREVTDMAHQLYAKPEDRETFKRGLADPGHVEGYEVESRRKDGTSMWVSVNARAVQEESGNVLYYEGTSEDITSRKQAEQALRRSESLLREAQRVAHIGHWEIDSPSGTPRWSEEIFHIFALDPARGEPSFAAHRDIIHPEDWELLHGSVTEASDHGTPFNIQFRVIRPDESIRWVEARGYHAGNAEGQTFRLFGTAQDITDLKKTDEQLRKSREMLELALAGADLGLWDWNVQTGNAVVTQRSADIIGYSLDEIDPGLEFLLRIMHPDDRSRVTDLLNTSLRGQTDAFESEYRVLAKSGEWKWALSRGKVMERAENGDPLRMTGTFMDVTNRKRAEEALRESEGQKQAILDGITTNIAFVNEDLEIQWVNKTAADSVGKLPSQMIGHKCHEFWADPDKPCDGCPTVKAFKTKKSEHTTTVTPDGRIWDEKGEPVFDDAGRLIGVVEIAQDITDRKRAEEALRESMDLMQYIVRNDPNAIAVYDRDLHYLAVSNRYLLDYNVKEEDIIGKHHYEVFPEMPQRWKDVHQRCLLGAVESEDDDYFERPDGSVTYNRWECRPWYRYNGEIGGIITYTEVTTERKKAEEELRESRERLQIVLDTIPAGVFWKNRDSVYVGANRAWLEGAGLNSSQEVVGKTDYDLPWEKDQANSYREHDRKVMESGIPEYDIFETYARADGTLAWAKTSKVPLRDLEGNVVGILGTYEDITDRKRAEEALSRQAEFMTHLMEAIPLPVFFKDVNHMYVGCNNSFAQFVGLPKERIVGKPVFDVFSQETAEIFKQHDEALFRNPGTQVYVTSVKRSDGSTREVIFNKATYGDPDGPVSGLIGVILDITDRKILEQQLLQAQKMEAIGTLAGGIAHDFNNLLTVVMGFSEMMLTAKEQDDPEYADLEKIFHAAQNGAELVQRLLMFSRKSEPKLVPINLNKQIFQVEKLLRRAIPRMVDISLDLWADLPEISADTSQIEQVLMNLAVNARDAMPDVGKLTVRTSAVTLDEEYCSLHVEASPGEHVVLEVSDTGHGMDKETVEHIFEPFFTTKEMGRGTGLGLAMVYGIVKQHNGHVAVDSEVGKGTTFRVYFPIIETDEEPEVEDSNVMPYIGTETVLLVDDEQLVRELGARILSKHGYAVLQAENGREALDLFKKERARIALVVLDLIMPEMGGTECLKELLKTDPQVKVLITSGFSADASIQETIQMGARGFVVKPFRVKELLRDVRRVLDEG